MSLTLGWDPNPEPDIIGYRVYYGTSSGNLTSSVGLVVQTTAEIPDLNTGTTYYFAVSAVNGSNLESALSIELSHTIAGNSPPLVTLSSPVVGSVFVSPAAVPISANASDNDGSINRVEFYLGGQLVAESSAPPYASSLNGLTAGSYTLQARAFDNAGGISDSPSTSLVVLEPTAIPTMTFTRPTPGNPAQLTIVGLPNQTLQLEVSTNLTDWVPTRTITNSLGTSMIDDLDTSAPSMYYRTRLVSETSPPLPTMGAVISLTLINADTNQAIAPLTNGGTLDLGALPTRNLNVRANTIGQPLGSIVFSYDSNQTFRTESAAPYALAGDSNGNYLPWTPSPGSHILIATPHSQSSGGGNPGIPHVVEFQVIP